MTDSPNCLATDACKAKSSAHCKSCAARLKYADPAARERMSAVKLAALADPEKRQRVASTAAGTLKAWHRRGGKLAWCPAELRPLYHSLRAQGVSARERRRIVEAEIPGTREHARRQIANVNLSQRLRHGRDLSQRY